MAIDRSEDGARVSLPNLKVSFPLDDAKAKEIRQCLDKGHLHIEITQVDLASGRLGDGWKYD